MTSCWLSPPLAPQMGSSGKGLCSPHLFSFVFSLFLIPNFPIQKYFSLLEPNSPPTPTPTPCKECNCPSNTLTIRSRGEYENKGWQQHLFLTDNSTTSHSLFCRTKLLFTTNSCHYISFLQMSHQVSIPCFTMQ